MDYNNYFSPQPNHPPPPNQQHGGGGGPGSGLQAPHQQQSHQMMHSPMPQQSTRQTMPPGHPSHHQQQQHMQHQSYQQIHPPHAPPVSHSNTPHAQQQAHHQHHNHQSNMTGPLPQQTIGSQHVHSQPPHHPGPMPPHMQSQQPLNQMVRPQLGPAVINHSQPGLNQPMMHQQNFFGGGPMPQSGLHYHQQNNHHQHHLSQSAHHHLHHQHQPPNLIHHGPPPLMAGHFPHQIQVGIGRSSPYFLHILQTELRMIEFNRRLQCRPLRYPNNPMPSHLDEHSFWWDKFASEFFEDDATLTLRLALEEKPVEYTIGRTLIPRFFRTYFDGGVTDLSINLRNPKETYIHPHMITLDCDQAFIVTNNIFKFTGMSSNHGVVVHTEGHLIIDFVCNNFDALSIKSWRFYTRRSHEYIDRAILTTLGLPSNYFAEPITKQGLTKSTVSYLKMCMIMEPMQELMFQHKQTKMDPRSCLRKLLFERYKFRSGEETRAATSKRRKRKQATTPAIGNTTTPKKSKAGINNSSGNNPGLNNNNILMSPSAIPPNFSLASQDVMVVGEPSMMGGDFGGDNERMITRLENTQYDPSASNIKETTDITSNFEHGNLNGDGNPIDSSQNHTISPTLAEQSSQQQARQISIQDASPPQVVASENQETQNSPLLQATQQQIPTVSDKAVASLDQRNAATQSPGHDFQQSSSVHTQSNLEHNASPNCIVSNESTSQTSMFQPAKDNQDNQQPNEQIQHEQQIVKLETSQQQTQNHASSQSDEVKQISPLAPVASPKTKQELLGQGKIDLPMGGNNVLNEVAVDDANICALPEGANGTNSMISVDSIGLSGNRTNLIQTLNDESNSSSQLVCSTADNTPAIEQQQPVNNGVA